jgi:PAS domain S-box-containing protein
MTDEQKTKQELNREIDILSRRVADLEQSELARKRAEEALRENEEKYRAMFENTGAATVVIEENSLISLANAEFVRLSGYSLGEIEGKRTWTEFVIKEDLERMKGQHRLRRQNGEKALRNYEFRFVRRNGDIRNIYLSIDVILGTTKSVASLLDITERRQAEEALQRSEAQSNQLAQENAIMAEIGRIVGSTLNIDEVYERFAKEVRKLISFDRIVISTIDLEKMTGVSTYIAGRGVSDRCAGVPYPLEGTGIAEMIRTKATVLVQPEDIQVLRGRFPMLVSTFQAGFRSIMNVPLYAKGEIIGGLLLRSVQPNAYSIKDLRLAERVGVQIAGAIANSQLYFGLRKIEAALRDTETRYRLLFEHSPDGIVILDPVTARPVEFNETTCRQLGYSREEFSRLSISDFEEAESPEETRKRIAKVIREGRNDFETRHRTRQGEIRNIHVTAQIMEVLGKTLYHCVWRDITERKRVEAEREKLIKDLQEALAKVKLLSGMLPICSSCRKIRDDKGYWNQIEVYVRDHSEAEFSHGICPECFKKLYPDVSLEDL